MTRDLHYFEDYSPGSGRRSPARSWLRSDAPALDLSGDWRFRYSATVAAAGEPLTAPEFDDSGWDLLPVPAHWVLHGDGAYGRPAYTNIRFPFPIDPPHVPDENGTGDYRVAFDLPHWDVEGHLLRFDGVESTYRVWLNGAEVGVGKGSRLVQEFDVGELLRPGRNVLFVRVHQWSSSSYLEDQDQWWLPGIFREVTLIGRPRGGIEDAWLRCDLDPDSGEGRIDPEIIASEASFPLSVSVPELGVETVFHSPGDVAGFAVGAVEPWSAEQPRLYDAVVASAGERVQLRIGFRRVQIVGHQFLVNGRRVVFHGVNRHEIGPRRGRVFDEADARRELLLMKQHNIDAIRTSHYPPHPRVLELTDELGFWVIDECDLETHGFNLVQWRGNPSDDPRWEDAYLDRIERTVERDKNHPSVILWSLGNESGTGRNLVSMSAWVHDRDPERPVHYEGDHQGHYTDVYSRMYANLQELESVASGHETLYEAGPGESERLRTKPFVLCEYAHAMGAGPGGLREYDELFDAHPRLHGGFVWEWRDHGLVSETADGEEYFAYGGDFGETIHDGNFVMDGLILSDGTPSPALADLAAVNAPIRFRVQDGILSIRNRHHSRDTGYLEFVAEREVDGYPVDRVVLDVPRTAPGESIGVDLPFRDIPAGALGEVWVTVRAVLRESTSWAAAGHPVVTFQYPLPRAAAATPTPEPRRRWRATAADRVRPATLGPASFDRDSGELTSFRGIPLHGPRLELWRAPTDNDRSAGRGSFELGTPEETGGLGVPGPSSDTRWRERGLDRLVHRTARVVWGDGCLRRSVRVGAAAAVLGVTADFLWSVRADENEVSLQVTVRPDPEWDSTWPRVGVRFDLPSDFSALSWFGTGPGESYPDASSAVRVGRFRSPIDELGARYARPQETGHRAAFRSLTLTGAAGRQIQVSSRSDAQGHRPGFTVSRHTPQQVDRARHPHELPAGDTVHLFIDDAQHGLGSRSCGSDVLPAYALWPSLRSFTITLS